MRIHSLTTQWFLGVRLGLGIVLVATFLLGPVSAEAATFSPVADAHTRSDYPNQNYGELVQARHRQLTNL